METTIMGLWFRRNGEMETTIMAYIGSGFKV